MKLPSKSIRRGATVTLSVLVAASALAAMAPSQALDSTRVGPRDSSRVGLPAYYTDDSGVALQLCVDGTARCGNATLRGDGAGGPGVGVAPDGEGFYWMATTSLSSAGLTLDIEFAAEAAWADRRHPITFDRLRIRGHSTAPAGTNIPVNTPYGVFTVTTEDPAEQRNVNFTEDIGCAIMPCNFRDMTTVAGRHITSWITANAAPRGYLGNAVTSQPANVAGAPATISAGGDSTSSWVVMGKLAPANRVSLPKLVNFGNPRSRVATKSVTMRNLGTTSHTIRRVTLKGSRAFSVLKSSTCKSGTALGVGARCKVDLRYRPAAAKRSAAKLTITDNVGAHRVRVRGR
jgi:hypothetical protein